MNRHVKKRRRSGLPSGFDHSDASSPATSPAKKVPRFTDKVIVSEKSLGPDYDFWPTNPKASGSDSQSTPLFEPFNPLPQYIGDELPPRSQEIEQPKISEPGDHGFPEENADLLNNTFQKYTALEDDLEPSENVSPWFRILPKSKFSRPADRPRGQDWCSSRF